MTKGKEKRMKRTFKAWGIFSDGEIVDFSFQKPKGLLSFLKVARIEIRLLSPRKK